MMRPSANWFTTSNLDINEGRTDTVMTMIFFTYGVFCFESLVRDAGVSTKPKPHGGTCRMLSRWSGVATKTGNDVIVGC